VLGEVAKGSDPASDKEARREIRTVAELCGAYLIEAKAGRVLTRAREAKRQSTLELDELLIERHIKPHLGGFKAPDVTHADVDGMMHAIAEGRGSTGRSRGGKAIATKAVSLLSVILQFGGRTADNPCAGVRKFRDGKKERRLSDDEFGLLGQGLRDAVTQGLPLCEISIIRFLALTGWRSSEASLLKWCEVDLQRRTASIQSKTGPSMRPLAKAACELVAGIQRQGVYVFPTTGADAPQERLGRVLGRILRVGRLAADITPHTLRHSFVSVGGDLEYSDATIGGIVGHVNGTMTGRYRHAADQWLLVAADRIAGRIASLMGDADNVVELRPGSSVG
jgi:integrase